MSARKRLRRAAAYAALAAVLFLMAFPLLWMTLASLKSEREIVMYPPSLLPGAPTFDAYRELFDKTAFAQWFWNSLCLSLLVTSFSVALSAAAAYVMARSRGRFFHVFSRLILVAYMVPSILMVIPVYQIVWKLELANTLTALFLVYNSILIPYGIWTLRSYFAGIPHEVEEAALIDGATRFQTFCLIVLPQAAPGLIATALFAFHVAWNEYLFASVLLWASEKMTLSAGIATLIGETAMYPWPVLMAAAVLVTVPVILLFSVLQRYLIAGWGSGAVKG